VEVLVVVAVVLEARLPVVRRLVVRRQVASVVRRRIKTSVVRLPVEASQVRLRVEASEVRRRWVVRLLVVVSAVLRRIKGSAVRRRVLVVLVVNNNSRWEWEELQCKVVRECKRRRVECSRIRVVDR
jgi:hypothetical protein